VHNSFSAREYIQAAEFSQDGLYDWLKNLVKDVNVTKELDYIL